MSIIAGLSATKTGFDLIKSLREYLKREDIDPREVNARLVELQELLLNAQLALSEAQTDNQDLRRELQEARDQNAVSGDLEMVDGGFYVRRSEKALAVVPAYCPACWGVNRKMVPLKPRDGTSGEYLCVVHNVEYNDPDAVRARSERRNAAAPRLATRPRGSY